MLALAQVSSVFQPSACCFPLERAHPLKPPVLPLPSAAKFAETISFPRRRRNVAKATNVQGEGKEKNRVQIQSVVPREEVMMVDEERVPLEGVIQFERAPSSAFSKWGRIAVLAGGDVLCLLLFTALGRWNHGLPVYDVETLHTADHFIAGWLLSAYFLGGYGPDGRGTEGLQKAVLAAAKSWAIGIPLGLIIRSSTYGHIPPNAFILISMGSTAFLLIGWRTLLNYLFPGTQTKENDKIYKRGNPFELLELLTSLVRRW